MDWIWLIYGPSVLWILLAIKPDAQKHPLIFAFALPIAGWFLVSFAILLIAYGSTIPDGPTQSFIGLEVSANRLRNAATMVGAGVITGLVAGSLIALTNRWHDHEK